MELPQILLLLLFIGGVGLVITELIFGLDAAFDLTLSGTAMIIGSIVGFIVGSPFMGLVTSVLMLIAYWVIGRTYVRRWVNVQLHPTNADKLLGITSKVTRTQGNGQGIIRIEGEEWSCDAEVDLKAGDKVRVIEVKGSLLAVEIIK